MTIRPTLSKPTDLLLKLKRERRRILHSNDITDRIDHIYNFFITSNSIKDYIFEHLQTPKEEKYIYRNEWDKQSILVSCKEISNIVKHHTLRDKRTWEKVEPKTKRMSKTTIGMVEFYEDVDDGKVVKTFTHYNNYEIETMNGEVFLDIDITQKVIDYWEKYLQDNSIP